MIVETSRFGPVEVDDDRVLQFSTGLLGFAEHHEYVLLQPDEDGLFYWLQSVECPDLAFIVTDPRGWDLDYRPTIRPEQLETLDLETASAAQLLVIVNRYDRALTANLQGPIIVNARNWCAMQLVLAERRWGTRHELVSLPRPAAMAV
jgi:flagellar assembly factor FliW